MRNFLSFSPQGRLMLLGGFGNLAGDMDIYDLDPPAGGVPIKVGGCQMSNATICDWSPCGTRLLTATFTPRLRVDNGFKVCFSARSNFVRAQVSFPYLLTIADLSLLGSSAPYHKYQGAVRSDPPTPSNPLGSQARPLTPTCGFQRIHEGHWPIHSAQYAW